MTMGHKTVAKLLVLLFAVGFISCSSKSGQSQKTGWAYNDRRTTQFEVVKKYKQDTPPGMVFVEGGTFTMGRRAEDIPGDWNNIPRRVTVASFFMDETEVSNLDWREYIHWMKIVFHQSPELVARAFPDTLVWREDLAFNDPYLEYYFSHAGYNNYPVVGVSWEQAMDYCAWRTDRVNELLLVEANIIQPINYSSIRINEDPEDVAKNQAFNTDKYLMSPEYVPVEGRGAPKDLNGNTIKTNMSLGILQPKFRLPTEAEWEYAALGLHSVKDHENAPTSRMYPWDGKDVRTMEKSRKYNVKKGDMRGNFVRGRGDMMGMGGSLNDAAIIPAAVRSYAPNDFGLYNMAGNVNEWVYDVYRPLSTTDVEEYNPFRGNEYKSPLFEQKTISSGREVPVPQIDSLGKVRYEYEYGKDNMTEYVKLDVRNSLDGDPQSIADPARIGWRETLDPDVSTARLYNADAGDAIGLLNSHISNTSRVYKGGSWKDRAYWLNPGSRRWAEQNTSSNDIGFRCAMSKVGPEVRK
ncbi:MAG: SUMF1/EgtB/PvdO family nonheme iron enzyme [Prevotellaceae bacterium]|jgi:gliding motility-associated lipoprotein GldJ|nr:SUMF1/EgtB/PvdO family nonheme iron enzyme [Prevotellaceae bacterium]